MSNHLNPDQFGDTLGSLHEGQRFVLPGHDGVYTATRNDVRAGKARVSYKIGSDPQEYSYVAPSLSHVERR